MDRCCSVFENQRMLGNISWAFEEFRDATNVGFCWDCGHEYCFTRGRRYMPLFGDKLIFTHITIIPVSLTATII